MKTTPTGKSTAFVRPSRSRLCGLWHRPELWANKGEELHALRSFLFFAGEGKVRRRQPEEQGDQALCLNLLADAVILWNTVYYQKAIGELRAEGLPVRDEDLARLSPTRHAHINPYGRYRFDLGDGEASGEALRPLRPA